MLNGRKLAIRDAQLKQAESLLEEHKETLRELNEKHEKSLELLNQSDVDASRAAAKLESTENLKQTRRSYHINSRNQRANDTILKNFTRRSKRNIEHFVINLNRFRVIYPKSAHTFGKSVSPTPECTHLARNHSQ